MLGLKVKLALFYTKKDIFKRSLTFTIYTSYDLIPDNLKSLNIGRFKSNLKKYLFSNK